MSEPTPLTEYQIRVLLVDDQRIVGETVKRMLQAEQDIIFKHCQNPAEAIPTALEFQPTVILQDLVMPDIDGMTLVRFFRNHPKLNDLPLLVLSTREDPVTKADAFARGANDYIVKLPDRLELIARIRYHSRGYISLLQRNDAYQALLASQKALAAELDRAAQYVRNMLPAPASEAALSTQWHYTPSTQLGGDSFGYHWIDPQNFAIYLLDVCGHGVGPALLSVSAINTLRNLTLPNIDFKQPNEVLAALNETFEMSRQNDLYFTIWYGVYNLPQRTLRYATAGHPPAFLFTNGSPAKELVTGGFFIGGLSGIAFPHQEVAVEPGSRFYVFSDGVYEVEPPGGPMWTLDELREWLAANARPDGAEVRELYGFLQSMKQDQVLDDDYSMLRIDFN